MTTCRSQHVFLRICFREVLTEHLSPIHQSFSCMYTLGIATSPALGSFSRSLVLTTIVGIMPATEAREDGAPRPDAGGYCRTCGIDRSFSCCSMTVCATSAFEKMYTSCRSFGEISNLYEVSKGP